jgi:glycosyltransferase involved in cell wall biosynthesis
MSIGLLTGAGGARARQDQGASAPELGVGLFSWQIGGSEKIGAELALSYRRRGYRVFCFAFYDSQGPVRDRLQSAGVECLDLNYLARRRGVRRRVMYQLELTRCLRQRRVTALHVHHTTALILCGVASRLAGVRSLLMTEHAIHELEASPAYKLAARFYCRLAHNISVVHPALVEYFRAEIRVPAARLHYIPNGVHVTAASPGCNTRMRLRRQYAVNEDEFVFLFAGRLHHTKDLSTLLQAAHIAAQTRRFRLWLVGDGPERADLEARTRRSGLADVVRFLGEVPDVAPYMQAADAFAMSSATEGLPMVLLEALSNHLPCIATRVGGIPELLRDGVGLVVPPQDPPQLADAMRRLMDDAEARERMSTLGAARIARDFDFERVVDQYLNVMRLPHAWPRVDQRTSSSHKA